MRILCVGDIFGQPGRDAVRTLVPQLIERERLDLVIANAENSAGGAGVTLETARDLLSMPIGLFTGGNHTWRHKEFYPLLDKEPRFLRPHNFPEGTPGRGVGLCETSSGVKVGVLNLQGRVFMDPLPSPFETALEAIEELRRETRIILVDIHAEATSEKRALAWHLDGKVSALFGTHTHVQTADEEILPGGTGYLTDLGMTGPYDSVIGMKKELVLRRFLTLRPTSFEVAKHDVRLCGAIFEIDPETGRTTGITRVRENFP
ncbi:MAG: TIGR00282 family metallophosphoesterase [Deltaproteobacteria bacterium]|nr:TIGR00282 family metallophosphoesterase [Deltaproteobacteria bacterium]